MIAEEIRIAPEAYDQGREYMALPPADGWRTEGERLPRPSEERKAATACGTPCCVAGWAYWLGGAAAGKDGHYADWEEQKKAARTNLGLTEKETDALCRTAWPREWFDAAGLPPRTKEQWLGASSGLREPDAGEATTILEWIADHGRMPPGTEATDDGNGDTGSQNAP